MVVEALCDNPIAKFVVRFASAAFDQASAVLERAAMASSRLACSLVTLASYSRIATSMAVAVDHLIQSATTTLRSLVIALALVLAFRHVNFAATWRAIRLRCMRQSKIQCSDKRRANRLVLGHSLVPRHVCRLSANHRSLLRPLWHWLRRRTCYLLPKTCPKRTEWTRQRLKCRVARRSLFPHDRSFARRSLHDRLSGTDRRTAFAAPPSVAGSNWLFCIGDGVQHQLLRLIDAAVAIATDGKDRAFKRAPLAFLFAVWSKQPEPLGVEGGNLALAGGLVCSLNGARVILRRQKRTNRLRLRGRRYGNATTSARKYIGRLPLCQSGEIRPAVRHSSKRARLTPRRR